MSLIFTNSSKVREVRVQAKTAKELEFDFIVFQKGWEKYAKAMVLEKVPKGNDRITFHKARLLVGFSKQQMAEIFGISLDWYYKIENGTSKSLLRYQHILHQLDSNLPGIYVRFT